jgi:thioredoxin 1
MSDLLIPVTDNDFEKDVLQANLPVLIDFWAQWCNPCKMFMPTVEELATQYQGKIKFVKMNIDENTQTPAKYGVRGIPTLILFKEGEVLATKVGVHSKSQLSAFLDSHL